MGLAACQVREPFDDARADDPTSFRLGCHQAAECRGCMVALPIVSTLDAGALNAPCRKPSRVFAGGNSYSCVFHFIARCMQDTDEDTGVGATVKHRVHDRADLVTTISGPTMGEKQDAARVKHGCKIPLPSPVHQL